MKNSLLKQLLMKIKESNVLPFYNIFTYAKLDIVAILELSDEQVTKLLCINDNMKFILELYFCLDGKGVKQEIKEVIKTTKAITPCLFLVLNSSVLARKDALEFVKIVAEAKKNYQVENASKVATNVDVLERKDALEFVKVVAEAKKSYQAEYASDVATNVDVLERKDALEFVKIVAEAKGEYQAECASDVATNIDVLERKDALQIIKAVAEDDSPLISRNTQNNVVQQEGIIFEEELTLNNIIKEASSLDSIVEALNTIDDNSDIRQDTKIKLKREKHNK